MSETAGVGLRERKKRATRQALHRAALRATLDRGLGQVTVEEIAESAMVSERTFFNYFTSKEDAVIGMDPEHVDRLRSAVLERPADEAPLTALRAVFVEHARFVDAKDREEWRDRFTAISQNPELVAAHLAAWSRMERAIVEAIAERTGLDPDTALYPVLVTSAAVNAHRVAAQAWRSDPTRHLADAVGEALDLLAAGLPPPVG